MKRVLIYGAGGHGKVVCDVLKLHRDIRIVGFADSDVSRNDTKFFGYNVVAGEERLKNFLQKGVHYAVIAIGDNGERKKVAMYLMSLGFKFVTAIHPSVVLGPTVNVGTGTVIFAGAVLNADAIVGDHVIVNTSAVIEHDCRVGSFSHIAPGAKLGGTVTIGEETLVGIGVGIRPEVVIGDKCTIGVGAVVVKNVSDGKTVVGNPTRELI